MSRVLLELSPSFLLEGKHSKTNPRQSQNRNLDSPNHRFDTNLLRQYLSQPAISPQKARSNTKSKKASGAKVRTIIEIASAGQLL